MARDREIQNLLRIKKLKYLRAQGIEGGYADGFRAYLRKDFKDHPEDYEDRVEALLSEVAAYVWGPPAAWEKKEDPDLFSIGGIIVPRELTFKDRSVPGDHRKPLSDVAPISFLREHALVQYRQVAQLAAAAAQTMRAFETGLERAGNDPTRLCFDVRDIAKRSAA